MFTLRYTCSATGRTVSYDSSCLISFRCLVWARLMWTTAARRTHTGTIFRTAQARTPDQPAISQLSPCPTTTLCSSWTPTMCWYSRPLPTQPRSWPSHPVLCCSVPRGGSTQSSQVRCRTQISIVTCQLTFFYAQGRYSTSAVCATLLCAWKRSVRRAVHSRPPRSPKSS